jgi:glycosyltransferase involved in cell wall biosynthesis
MKVETKDGTDAGISLDIPLPRGITISCIVPVHNGERFLRETLDSILQQSYPVHETIVVDDGSTDNTPVIVEQYIAANGGRIRYLRQENSGPAAARNVGICLAESEYIGFLDADDLWHPDKCARQLAHFAACPQLSISVTNVQNFWMEEVRDEEERMKDQARGQAIVGYIAQSLLAKRAVFAKIGLFDAKLQHASVADWFLRVEEAGLVVELLPELLVWRRLHLDNRSRKLANNSRMEYFRLLQTARACKRSNSNDLLKAKQPTTGLS